MDATVSDEAEWLLPSIGSLDTVRLAIAAVRRALGYAESKGKAGTSAKPAPPLTDLERGLCELMLAQANLSAVLVQLLEHSTRGEGTPVSGEAVLGLIGAHQQARADLDFLDYAVPFDEP